MAKSTKLMPSAYHGWRKTWKHNFDSPLVRFFAWLDLYFVDHGLLRAFYNRPSQFSNGAYRSNHPSPRRIKKLASQGIRTIVSLRGQGSGGAYLYEEEACRRHGIELITFRLYSRRPPPPAVIHELSAIFARAEKPLLLHCKSGADRAGLGAALYVLLTGGDIASAQAQLSLRYLHLKQSRTGVLDHLLAEYARFNQHQPTAFLDWVDNYYDPDAVRASFKPKGWANWLVDGVLRRE